MYVSYISYVRFIYIIYHFIYIIYSHTLGHFRSVTKKDFFSDFFKSLTIEICWVAKLSPTVLLEQIQRVTTVKG